MGVRLESVRLSLDDDFTSGMARAAAATAVLRKSLGDLDGTNVRTNRGLSETATQTDRASASFRRGTSDINQFSGRLRLIADAALTLGPALIPIGAVAIPAVTGLASALGFVGAGATAVIAGFQGVGDALKAMNKAHLEPTTENLQAARDAMQQISPQAREFVRELTEMGPALKAVRDAAASGLFSELTPALDDLEAALPRVASLFETLGAAMGDLGADAIGSLTGPEWADFFSFIEAEAPAAIAGLGSAIGTLAHGFAELWMAFGPVNDSFLDWLNDAARGFDRWAEGLSQTQGFEDFTQYLAENGPKVAKAMGALANAFIQVVEAAAPLGGPTLDAITQFANAIATLADSPVGTPLFAMAAGLTALSRAAKLAGGASLTTAGLTANLTRLAGTGVPVVLALGTISDTLSQMDSLKRSSELADTFANSVDELAISLSQSNVGKYAEDLGIDIERLAEDLVKNGESGAYASAVLDQLSESSHGVGAALNSLGGNILPFYTANADKAYDANKDLKQSIENMTPGNLTNALPWLADAMGRLGGKARNTADAFRDGADAAQTFSDALLEFSGWLSKQQALRNYETAVRDLGAALKDGFQPKDKDQILAFAAAIEQVASQISDKGNRADFLKGAIQSLEDFAGKGPLAAEALKPLLNQLDKLDNYGPVDPPIGMNDRDFKSKARNIMADLSHIDRQKPTPRADLNTGLFTPKGKAVNSLLDAIDQNDPKPTVSVDDKASGPLRQIKSLMDGLHDKSITMTTYLATVHTPRAQGGPIVGPGTKTSDDVPVMASNGEFMMRAAAVDHYGLDAMYAMNSLRLAAGGLVANTHAKRLANGGPVSGASSTFTVASDISRGLDSVFVPWAAIMRQELKAATQRRDALKEDLDAIRDHRNALRDAARSLKDSIADQFRGSDLFSAEGADFGSILSGLKTSAGEASQFASLSLRLKALGLDGDALQALLQTGNLSLLQDFASQGSSQLALFEAQFNQTQQQAQMAGSNAALTVLGEQLAQARMAEAKAEDRYKSQLHETKVIQKKLDKQIEATKNVGADVGNRINRASAQAQRRPK